MSHRPGSSGLRSIVTLVLLAGFVVAAGSEVAHLRAWFLSRAANRAYYRGDLETALEAYERARDLLPGYSASHTDLADSIAQVLESDPSRFDSRDTYEEMAARAAGCYLDAIRVAPPNAWAYAGLSSLAGNLGAKRRRESGVDLAAFIVDPLESLTPEDRLQEAAMVRAVQLEPRNFYYRDFLAHLYWTHGFWDRAEAHVREAVRLQPALHRHFYLSDLVTVSPRVLNAVERGVQDALASGATEVSPEQIHRLLAEIYLRLGRPADARESFEAAVAFSDSPHLFEIHIGRTFVAEGDDRQALQSFLRATDLAPEYHFGWLHLGLTLSRLDRHEEAVTALRRARGLTPTEYRPAWHLTAELDRIGETDEAARILDGLIQSHPDKPDPYARLIEIYLRQGNADRAARVARQLVDRYPDNDVFKAQLRQLEAGAAR